MIEGVVSLPGQTDLERHDVTTETVATETSADWIRHWYGRVHALCQAKLRSRADAEDATQEAFLRAIAGRHRLKNPDAVGGWLRGIANHVCVDVIRRNQRQPISPQICDASAPDDSQTAQEREEQRRLIDLVHQLPEVYRETILLHYFESMTYDEIASWLGVARSTVNERLSKGRQKLKQQLLVNRCHDEM